MVLPSNSSPFGKTELFRVDITNMTPSFIHFRESGIHFSGSINKEDWVPLSLLSAQSLKRFNEKIDSQTNGLNLQNTELSDDDIAPKETYSGMVMYVGQELYPWYKLVVSIDGTDHVFLFQRIP